MSSWGVDPPEELQKWVEEHYVSSAVDENINLTYTNDDIRLCTMQRAIPQQKIGVQFHYFPPERFHYFKLTEDLASSLAHRAGLKPYDRIIFYNGINVESDTKYQFSELFKTSRNLPVQVLVCSPATYEHYKANNKRFHYDLPTIQRLKPVYATSIMDSHTDVPAVSFDHKTFYAVKWVDSNVISTMPQSAAFKAPEFTKVDDTCFIEIEGEYRKGQIIDKGTRTECDNLSKLSVQPGINDYLSTFQVCLDLLKNKLPISSRFLLPIINPLNDAVRRLELERTEAQVAIQDPTADTQISQDNDVVQCQPKLTDAKHWTIDDVCRWVQSLKQIGKDYSNSFRANGIDGSFLLTYVDDEVLKELDVSAVHRKLIMKEIKELKSNRYSLSTKSGFYGEFEGDFTPFLHATKLSSASTTFSNVSACVLTKKEHSTIVSRIYNWLGTLPTCYRVEKLEFIFNSGIYRNFLGQIEIVESRQKKPEFQATLDKENVCKQRKQVLQRLETLCHQVSHNRRLRIARMWHGCRRSVLPHLLSDGFAALSMLDDGWYGKAIYFTSSAKYATRYFREDNGCLVMCYVLLLNPFPVVSDDAPPDVPPEKFRFYGRGNYKNYQCHYIPVSPVGGKNTMDYRPPPTGDIDDAEYDELAVFQEAHILPQIVIYCNTDD
ncbi:unnamed protein product [Rotaria sp. Silwood2]|nr:unnamed protein product [Rotaria sp. Silwood2]CAF3153561.1 unnamed protein product [Rotaria sp. Silwood2]CAF4468418.1 unnamed protein product [Rotaria sp. Silwood2]